MARTIRLKETDLTKIVRRVSESRNLLMEKWVLRPWVKQVITIGNAISGLLTAWAWCCSDSRLKKNIKRVGRSKSGINIYEFEYKNKARYGGGRFRGVLAEEAPRKATKVMSNGYRYVNYNLIDVNFERLNQNNAVRLSEGDLSRVIKRVINERRFEMPDLTKGTVYYPDMDMDDIWGGQSQGGGSDDPMAYGNEEMEFSGEGNGGENDRKCQEFINMIGNVLPHSSAMAADISNGRNNPGWDAEKSQQAVFIDNLLQTAYQELSSDCRISQGTMEDAVQAKTWLGTFFRWVRGLFMMEIPDPPACFAEGDEVEMFNGNMMAIELIKIGDEIKSSRNGQTVRGIVTETLVHPTNDVVEVVKLNGITAEPKHPILIDGQWVAAKTLGTISYEFINNWYNLEIDADVEDSEHNYIIGGLVVSGLGDNVKLNNKYQRQPKELTLSLNN